MSRGTTHGFLYHQDLVVCFIEGDPETLLVDVTPTYDVMLLSSYSITPLISYKYISADRPVRFRQSFKPDTCMYVNYADHDSNNKGVWRIHPLC